MIRLSTVTIKKKPWKIPNIKKVKILRNHCEKITSMIDQGLSLYVIAKKTKYPKEEILNIARHRYDLLDMEDPQYSERRLTVIHGHNNVN